MADVKLSKLATKRLPSATSLIIGSSTANTVPTALAATSAGSLTANVWKEVFNLSSPGVLLGAAVRGGGSGAENKIVGIRVTIDGTVVVTSEMTAAAGGVSSGAWIGMFIGSTTSVSFGWAPFQTLKVEVRSDINTTSPLYGVHYTGLEI